MVTGCGRCTDSAVQVCLPRWKWRREVVDDHKQVPEICIPHLEACKTEYHTIYMYPCMRICPSRNAFNWVSYFFLLYNAIVGFLGAILRVLLAMLFGILLLFRLDTNIMMKGFQFADLGS